MAGCASVSSSCSLTSARVGGPQDLRALAERAFDDVLARPGTTVTLKRVSYGLYHLMRPDAS
jgi:hypothetical protein